MNAPTLVPTTTLGEPATMIGQRTPKQSLFLLVAVVLLVCGSATSSLAADQPPKSAPQQRAWLLSHLVTDMQSAGQYTSFGRRPDGDSGQQHESRPNWRTGSILSAAEDAGRGGARSPKPRRTCTACKPTGTSSRANSHGRRRFTRRSRRWQRTAGFAPEQAQCALQHFDAAASRPHVLYAPHRHR